MIQIIGKTIQNKTSEIRGQFISFIIIFKQVIWNDNPDHLPKKQNKKPFGKRSGNTDSLTPANIQLLGFVHYGFLYPRICDNNHAHLENLSQMEHSDR